MAGQSSRSGCGSVKVDIERQGPMTLGQVAQLLEYEDIVERAPEAAWTRNASCHWALPDGCDVTTAAAAVRALTMRHEVLRTTFARDAEGRPVQAVHPTGREVVEIRDLRRCVAEHGSIRRLMAALQRLPMSLDTEPPVRFEILTEDDSARDVVMVFHHIVADVRTCQILQRDLAALLEALRSGRGVERRAPRQPVDEALAQESRVSLSDGLAPWRRVLAAAPPTQLPVLDDNRRASSYTAVFESATLQETSEALSRSSRLLPAQVLLGLYAFVLSRYTGLGTTVVCVISSNRFSYPSAVHCCALRIPFAIPIADAHEVEELLDVVRESTDGLYRNADHDVRALRRLLADRQTATGFNTRFRMEYNYLRNERSSAPAAGPRVPAERSGRFSHHPAAPADPSLTYLEARAGRADTPLVLTLEANEALLPLPAAESLVRAMEALAEHLAGDAARDGTASWQHHLAAALKVRSQDADLLPYGSGVVDRARVARAVAEELHRHRDTSGTVAHSSVEVVVAGRGTVRERLVARVDGTLGPTVRNEVLAALHRRAESDAALVVPRELVTGPSHPDETSPIG